MFVKRLDSTSTATFAYKAVISAMAIGVLINMMLNYYWAYLIVH